MLPPIPPQVNNNKKPTSVISWLGFGLSLATFLILIISIILVAISGEPALMMLTVVCCSPLGFIGFVFSIIGLIIAIKNCTPKWMSVSGIIFCCLSLLTPIFIVMIGAIAMADHKTDQTIEEAEYYYDAASSSRDKD